MNKVTDTSAGVCIVTGATGGIGRAIVEALMRRGVHEICMACRNISRAENLAAELRATIGGPTRLSCRQLDLESLASVRKFASGCAADNIKISVLFNNAGTMPGGVHLTADGFESATQTNYIATALLTRLLLPQMQQGSAIVFTTSMTRHIVRRRADWQQRAIEHHGRFTTYGRSKLMLTDFARGLAHELAPRGIRVNCSDPGIVDSGIITMGHPLIDRLADIFFRPIIHSPARGARGAIRAALDSDATGRIFYG